MFQEEAAGGETIEEVCTASVDKKQQKPADFKDTRIIGFDVDPIPRHRLPRSPSPDVRDPASDLIMGTKATLVYPTAGDHSSLLQDFQVKTLRKNFLGLCMSNQLSNESVSDMPIKYFLMLKAYYSATTCG